MGQLSSPWIPLLAVVAGALLTAFGSWVNDFFAQRREERRADREAQRQQERWKREDRIRREERDREESVRKAKDRAQAYERFMNATTFIHPIMEESQAEFTEALNESLTAVYLNASDGVAQSAESLYDAALEAMKVAEAQGTEFRKLEEERKEFWRAVWWEMKDDPQGER